MIFHPKTLGECQAIVKVPFPLTVPRSSLNLDPETWRNLHSDHQAASFEEQWQELEPDHQRKLLQTAISKVTLQNDRVSLELTKQGLAQLSNAVSLIPITEDFANQTLTVEIITTLKQCRWETRLVIQGEDTSKRKPEYNNALIRAVAQAHYWRERLLTEEGLSVRSIAEEYEVNERYIGRRLKLAYLSPEIVDNILNGLHPPELSLDMVEKRTELSWDSQTVIKN